MAGGPGGARGLERKRMPEFHGGNVGFGSHLHPHGDGVAFESLYGGDGHIEMQSRRGACEPTAGQSTGQGQNHAQWLNPAAYGAEQEPDQ